MLKLENVNINRASLCVAKDLNLNFEKGKIYAILGPNGAGKSSLISAIFGTIKFEGKISFKDEILSLKNSHSWRKNIGYMPQDNSIDANLSALEVVLLGFIDHLGIYLSDKQLLKAANIMQKLGILDLAQRDIMSLSGGQRQMVMFASVLLKNPKILLLDEPVSALDMHHQCVLLEAVKKQTQKEKLITLIVLHDLSLAAQFADELVILNDAKIVAKGYAKNIITKELIEKIYLIKAEIFYNQEGLPFVAAKSAY